jgi:hypothetical protein
MLHQLLRYPGNDPSAPKISIAHNVTNQSFLGWCIASSSAMFWESSDHTHGCKPGTFQAEKLWNDA